MRIDRSVRPRRFGWRDESGAISVFVAIVTVFLLLPIAVLAVDGGNLFMQRRRIVGATDAATIAAAQWCAQNLVTPQADTVTFRADDTASKNVPTSSRTAGLEYSSGPSSPGQPSSSWTWTSSQCNNGAGGGYVRATYGVPATQVFIINNKTVHSTAIAAWGAAGGGTGVMPMALQEARLSNCNIKPPNFPPPGTKCAFWLDDKAIGTASWGWADLGSGWNVAKTQNCPNPGNSEIKGWLTGGAGQLLLNYPEPTYVCVVSGAKAGDVKKEMQDQVGNILQFPVNDPCHITPPGPSGALHGQVDKSGNQVCPPSDQVDKFDIVGFAKLKLTSVDRGKPAEAPCTPPIGDPGGPVWTANGVCIVATWLGYQTGGFDPQGGWNFGEQAIGLFG